MEEIKTAYGILSPKPDGRRRLGRLWFWW